jgi:hypothetical protein
MVGMVVYIEVGEGLPPMALAATSIRAVNDHPQEVGGLADTNRFGGLGGWLPYLMATWGRVVLQIFILQTCTCRQRHWWQVYTPAQTFKQVYFWNFFFFNLYIFENLPAHFKALTQKLWFQNPLILARWSESDSRKGKLSAPNGPSARLNYKKISAESQLDSAIARCAQVSTAWTPCVHSWDAIAAAVYYVPALHCRCAIQSHAAPMEFLL